MPAFQPYRGKPAVRKCVQLRLVCSAGGRPAGAKVRRPVVWIAGWREIKILKPIDKVSLGETTSCRAVMTVNVNVARSEEHTSELQSLTNLVCRLLLEK